MAVVLKSALKLGSIVNYLVISKTLVKMFPQHHGIHLENLKEKGKES